MWWWLPHFYLWNSRLVYPTAYFDTSDYVFLLSSQTELLPEQTPNLYPAPSSFCPSCSLPRLSKLHLPPSLQLLFQKFESSLTLLHTWHLTHQETLPVLSSKYIQTLTTFHHLYRFKSLSALLNYYCSRLLLLLPLYSRSQYCRRNYPLKTVSRILSPSQNSLVIPHLA